jgi:transcriptional regulator with XRE-family HTH domain
MSEQPDLVFDPSEFPTFFKARMMQDSAAEFAKKLGITTNYVYMLMKGERPPSPAILKKMGLQVYYGVPKSKSKK